MMSKFGGLAFFLLSLAASVHADLTSSQVADAWHLDYTYTLATERLDPVVNPNAVSAHLHRIIGGNMFGANYDVNQYTQSTCTSVAISKDFSNYWQPQLYWMENGTYIPISASHRFYYYLGRNNASTPVLPFPPGLRMLTGNPNAKTMADTGMNNSTLQFVCHNGSTVETESSNFNFPYDCPQGMKSQVRFPCCWDGVNLYKTDGSHMSFASNIVMGTCPLSHPYRIPSILLEYTWRMDLLRPGVPLNGHLIWSNGDTTGYGIHADFVAAWDTAVLNTALNDPNCVGNLQDMQMTACPSLAPYVNLAAAAACKPARGVLAESTNVGDGNPTKSLPGCNLPWASGSKPVCNPAVANPPLPPLLTGTDGSYVYTGNPNASLQAAGVSSAASGSSVSPAGSAGGPYNAASWTHLSCLGDSPTARTLLNQVNYTDTAMTVAKCQEFCYEWAYQYAGLESGYICQCANSINKSQFTSYSCVTACYGNSSQTCGGNGIVDVYNNPTVPATRPQLSTDPSYVGCYHEGSNGARTLATYYYASSTLTVDMCKQYCLGQGSTLAGLIFGTHCECANAFTNGGGGPLPNYLCATPCPGNSSQICGGSTVGLSVFNLTVAQANGLTLSKSSSQAASASVSVSVSVSASASKAVSSTSGSSGAPSVASKAARTLIPEPYDATVTVTETQTVTVYLAPENDPGEYEEVSDDPEAVTGESSEYGHAKRARKVRRFFGVH